MHNRLTQGQKISRCGICQRGYRPVGQAIGSDLCIHCYDLAGMENQLSDVGSLEESEKEFVLELFKDCKFKKGNMEKVEKNFATLLKYCRA